jgi:hypothetical protein
VEFTEEQITALRSALGLAEDVELDEEALVQAAGALRERADQHVSAASGRPAGEAEGVITVDREAWELLNNRVRRGEEARAAQLRGERDQVIASAISEGKFSVAQRERWVRAWDANPEGIREVLASLQPNVVPVNDLGEAGDEDDARLDDYNRLFPPDYRATTVRPGR